MKPLNLLASIFLAALWLLAAGRPNGPDYIPPATIEPPVQATVSRETGPGESFTKPAETSPVALDLPPMQAEPDAISEPAGGLEVVLETNGPEPLTEEQFADLQKWLREGKPLHEWVIPPPTIRQSLTVAPAACATCAPAAAQYRPVHRQPVYQQRRGLFNGRFRR